MGIEKIISASGAIVQSAAKKGVKAAQKVAKTTTPVIQNSAKKTLNAMDTLAQSHKAAVIKKKNIDVFTNSVKISDKLDSAAQKIDLSTAKVKDLQKLDYVGTIGKVNDFSMKSLVKQSLRDPDFMDVKRAKIDKEYLAQRTKAAVNGAKEILYINGKGKDEITKSAEESAEAFIKKGITDAEIKANAQELKAKLQTKYQDAIAAKKAQAIESKAVADKCQVVMEGLGMIDKFI